jgi:hypothetical protein
VVRRRDIVLTWAAIVFAVVVLALFLIKAFDGRVGIEHTIYLYKHLIHR